MTKADEILKDVYRVLKLENSDSSVKYSKINEIVGELQKKNAEESINVKTTGTISERLCELALKTAVPEIYEKLPRDWKWVGDFSVRGKPFNLIISVKSFKAKERLLASGTGNILSPTIGWGLFNDIKEWTPRRVQSYVFRGFFAIYVPKELYKQIPSESKKFQNMNNNKFIRIIDDFIKDLKKVIVKENVDITKI